MMHKHLKIKDEVKIEKEKILKIKLCLRKNQIELPEIKNYIYMYTYNHWNYTHPLWRLPSPSLLSSPRHCPTAFSRAGCFYSHTSPMCLSITATLSPSSPDFTTLLPFAVGIFYWFIGFPPSFKNYFTSCFLDTLSNTTPILIHGMSVSMQAVLPVSSPLSVHFFQLLSCISLYVYSIICLSTYLPVDLWFFSSFSPIVNKPAMDIHVGLHSQIQW